MKNILCYYGYTYKTVATEGFISFLNFLKKFQEINDDKFNIYFFFQSEKKMKLFYENFKDIKNFNCIIYNKSNYNSWSEVNNFFNEKIINFNIDTFFISDCNFSKKSRYGSKLTLKMMMEKIKKNDCEYLKFNAEKTTVLSYLPFFIQMYRFDKIKLFYFIMDPNENSFANDDLKDRVFEFFEYKIKRTTNSVRRFAYSSYFLAKKYFDKIKIEKKYDLVFGYSSLLQDKNCFRKTLSSKILDIENKLNENYKILFFYLFKNEKNEKINTLISAKKYLNLILESKFTYIIPSYDEETVSMMRIYDALSRKCVTIFSDKINFECDFFKFNDDLLDLLKKYDLICNIDDLNLKMNNYILNYNNIINDIENLNCLKKLNNEKFYNEDFKYISSL